MNRYARINITITEDRGYIEGALLSDTGDGLVYVNTIYKTFNPKSTEWKFKDLEGLGELCGCSTQNVKIIRYNA